MMMFDLQDQRYGEHQVSLCNRGAVGIIATGEVVDETGTIDSSVTDGEMCFDPSATSRRESERCHDVRKQHARSVRW